MHRQHHDGHHVGAEFEDYRGLGVVGQRAVDHVELVAYVVGQHIDVFAVFKFEGNQRDVLTRFRCYVLQVVDGIEGIFQRPGHILFDILCTRSLIGGHDHDCVGLHIGIKVDREGRQREKAEDGDRHET